MSDESQPRPSDKPPAAKPRQQYMLRYPTKSSTLVILETDVMRTGLEARLVELSAVRLTLRLEHPMKVGEQCKITLSNEIQRLRKETRGIVRKVEPVTPSANGPEDSTGEGDEGYLIDLELMVRMTPLEVMLLRMAIPSEDGRPKWV